MTEQLPQVIHTYQNHTLDSTRWRSYQPRPDDIIIATAYKSGTTWMQEIVRQLVFLGQATPLRDAVALDEVSFWLDPRWDPLGSVMAKLEAQPHRRFIKTHIPLDGLPFFPQVKYIIVGRDPRDVFMSLWNFHANFTPDFYTFTNNFPDRVGDPFPACPADIHAFWHDWITRGWFAWQSEGYPYWGNLHHSQSWWNFRHLPNLLFVHYNDLKRDLAEEIRRIANFLTIPLSEQMLPAVMDAVSLEAMRAHAEKFDPGLKALLTEGATTFFYKGVNGRWQDVLSAEELALYDAKARQVLTSDCRAWLEQGRSAL
jgi:aryl sulfotransferase